MEPHEIKVTTSFDSNRIIQRVNGLKTNIDGIVLRVVKLQEEGVQDALEQIGYIPPVDAIEIEGRMQLAMDCIVEGKYLDAITHCKEAKTLATTVGKEKSE